MTAVKVCLALIGLFIAVVWHQSLVGRALFLGHKPDFVLVLVCVVASRIRPALGAAYGFGAGLFQGASAGADLTALCISRTVLGFGVSFVNRVGLQFTTPIVSLVAVAGTLFGQTMLLFMAPPPDIGRFLAATIGTAIYNGVFAGLLDLLLRRTLEPQVD